MKLCECGCGRPTSIAKVTNREYGHVKGQPVRFIIGHAIRKVPRGTYYAGVSRGGKNLLLHRVRAEAALGRPLPDGVHVHHADGTRNDDAPLVICQDQSYHLLLHARMRVKAAGGNPNTDAICTRCHTVKDRSAFTARPQAALGVRTECNACRAALNKAYRHRKRAA